MSAGVFRRVLAPVEFEPATDAERKSDATVEEVERGWVSVGKGTIRALELAARLAQDGELWLVHASPDFFDYATWVPATSIADLNSSTHRHSTAALETIAKRHCPGVELHYVVKPGKALDVILETAKEHPPDAIVLAASSRGKVHRAFLGSTADKVIRQSPFPVLVVPSGSA